MTATHPDLAPLRTRYRNAFASWAAARAITNHPHRDGRMFGALCSVHLEENPEIGLVHAGRDLAGARALADVAELLALEANDAADAAILEDLANADLSALVGS